MLYGRRSGTARNRETKNLVQFRHTCVCAKRRAHCRQTARILGRRRRETGDMMVPGSRRLSKGEACKQCTPSETNCDKPDTKGTPSIENQNDAKSLHKRPACLAGECTTKSRHATQFRDGYSAPTHRERRHYVKHDNDLLANHHSGHIRREFSSVN